MELLASPALTPEEQVQGRELCARLEEAIDLLPESYRLVFMLREVQQLDVEETSACLEISEENVKVRLHRAKAMLRQSLRTEHSPAERAFHFLGARWDRIVEAVLSQLRGKLDATRR